MSFWEYGSVGEGGREGGREGERGGGKEDERVGGRKKRGKGERERVKERKEYVGVSPPYSHPHIFTTSPSTSSTTSPGLRPSTIPSSQKSSSLFLLCHAEMQVR